MCCRRASLHSNAARNLKFFAFWKAEFLLRYQANTHLQSYALYSDIAGGKGEKRWLIPFMFPNPGIPYPSIDLEPFESSPDVERIAFLDSLFQADNTVCKKLST